MKVSCLRWTTRYRTAPKHRWGLGIALSCLVASPCRAEDGPYAVIERLADVLVRVEQSYVDPVDRKRLLEGAAAGMVAELDPHSAYLTPSQFAQFLEDTEGRFAGIGVEVDFRDDQVTVIVAMPNSPAERAHIQAGDRIVAVDGVPITGFRADSVVRRMRGPAGTQVKLTIRRAGLPEPITVTVTRAVVAVPSVEGRLLDHDVAYVRLKVFQEGCYSELLNQLATLGQKAKFTSLILDLRGNPGGLVNEALAIADEFLDAGVIYSARHRGKVVESVRSYDGDLLEKLPLVVLVNASTASSAEIVTGALQDRGRAQVIGAPTFGKGSVQNIIELEGGAGLLLTTLRYFTPKGHAIQARGLVPDVIVSTDQDRGSLREADMAGHLPTEGANAGPLSSADTDNSKPPPSSVQPTQTDDATTEQARRKPPVERVPLESIASTPSAEVDPVLAKGFELLRLLKRK